MKETVLDVLMYLFESFVDSEDEPEPDRNELREELEWAGFRAREIDRALDWLDGLNAIDIDTDAGGPCQQLSESTTELNRSVWTLTVEAIFSIWNRLVS